MYTGIPGAGASLHVETYEGKVDMEWNWIKYHENPLAGIQVKNWLEVLQLMFVYILDTLVEIFVVKKKYRMPNGMDRQDG